MSEKRDLWIAALLALAAPGLLAWNLLSGSTVLGIVAALVGSSAAVTCLPIRLRRGQARMVAFAFGALLLLVPTIPGYPPGWVAALPWVVAALAFLRPLGTATERVRRMLLTGAGVLAAAAGGAAVGLLPAGLLGLLLAGAFHLAAQVWSSRPRPPPEPPPGPRVCVFGGSFDPFHRGHRALVEAALRCHERVLVIVAAEPPHKPAGEERTPFHHRVAMARLGVEGLARTEVLELEGRRPPPHYTVDTLRILKGLYPEGTRFRLLLGADSFQDFPNWKDWEAILELATLIVAARPGHDLDPPPEFEGRSLPLELLEAPAVAVAGSDLRRALGRGEEPGERVSPAVMAYVRDHALYRGGAGARPGVASGAPGG